MVCVTPQGATPEKCGLFFKQLKGTQVNLSASLITRDNLKGGRNTTQGLGFKRNP